jgi:PadR family transcriptional regulator, regulatory protein PadR
MGYSEDAKERRIVQLRKGILELAVMGVLYHERHYGYSLIRVLTEQGSISLKEGTIYPILARLSQDGMVHSEWVESDQGPPRKYYALTSAGRKLYSELRKDFDVLVSLINQEWIEREHQEDGMKKLLVRKGGGR